jgi:eukaryotic-like serine/threonine-protein kinase
MPLAPGTRLGPYEIVSALGAGGMGEVYRARDGKLNREVALKVLPESVAADPDRLARFHREAQVLGALNHPNIAQIYGFEDSGATHAIVMELVEGPTLADRIAEGPMPVDEAMAIARQIVDALEAAHEQGIIHRDLKPANVKVREDGTVKVLDFGLAKALDPTSSSGADVMNSPTLTARATQLGVILGTAAYMAPEQAKGKAVDRRADIWAFGVVLFEMLAGQRAFKGEDVSDVLAAVLRQEIDWTALPASTPARLRLVLERCLERDPKKRLRDIGDVWIGMDTPDAPAAAAPSAAAPRRPGLARWLPWVAAFVIAGVSVAWAMLRATPSEPQLVTRSIAPMKDLALLVNVSRDGTRLAYVTASNSGGFAGITLRMLDQFEGRIVPGTEGGAVPLFSPDGQWIAYTDVGTGAIKKIPVTGGTAIRLCEGGLAAGAAWGDDDTIVFSGSKGLMRVSGDGGTPEALTTLDATKGETAHIRPQFLPGGHQLLFTVISSEGAQFAVRDLDKDGYRVIAKGGDNGQYAPSGHGSPNRAEREGGHLTFVRGTTLFAMPFDLQRLEVTGGEVPVVENVSTIGPTGTGDYSMSEGGLLAYFSTTESQGTTLAWADRAGATKVLPGQSKQAWGTGRLSPDGHLVANSIGDDRGGRDIWTFDVERGTLTRLTFNGQNDLPVWTPDSRRVFYGGTVDGKHGLYSVPADASAKAALVLATDQPATPTSFTPDGKTLVYNQMDANRKQQIFTLAIPTEGQPAQPRPLHEAAAAELAAVVSPDGHWVAYVSVESGSAEVYVQPFPGPGPKARVSLSGGTSPRWSKDGRELLYWADVPSARLLAVDVTGGATFHAGEPHELFKQLSTTTWDTTPDRNRFLVELSSRQAGSQLAIVTNWFDELRRRAPAKK